MLNKFDALMTRETSFTDRSEQLQIFNNVSLLRDVRVGIFAGSVQFLSTHEIAQVLNLFNYIYCTHIVLFWTRNLFFFFFFFFNKK